MTYLETEATCFGSYDGIVAFGCDECCGHGNEDGTCTPLTDQCT